jgi:hypothetical protein
MKYIYIGFMLAIGGCLGIGLFLFLWRNTKRVAKAALNVIYLLAVICVAWYYWTAYPHPLAALAAWLQTRNGMIATIGSVGITIMLIAELLRPQYRGFVSLSPCATCAHSQKRHRNLAANWPPTAHCLMTHCGCSNFVEMCRTCKHPEHQHSENKCLREGCSCRVRLNIRGAVIAFSLAVFVFVLLIVMRGNGH